MVFKRKNKITKLDKDPELKKDIQKIVRKAIKRNDDTEGELKYFDTVNANTVDFSGSVIALTDIPQGDTDLTRDGDSLLPINLEMRLVTFVADAYNAFRVIIFRWHPYFGSDAPGPAEILQLTGSSNAVNSPYNHDLRNNFTILYDKTRMMVDDQDNNSLVWQKKLKLKPKQVQYVAASTTNQSMGLYCLMISDSSQVSDPGSTYYFRVYYHDH